MRFFRTSPEKLPAAESEMIFSKQDLKQLLLPLLAEQFLVVLIGIMDTSMGSCCGESAMRGASALGKEWYEHSEGFCDALKGKTRTEIAGLSGGDADLKALCTIDITDLQKAALDALS